MLIKKLAVPFINDKLLQQAEHCTIATAAISEAAFDFIRTRIPPKCKIDIVTGLDLPTSPEVLKRIWKHYQERITFHIYTKNFFHANLYIIDLPYRKAVAFVGSGHWTLEGLKDHEEIFYKITDPKEIENLRSWFTGYYEFAEPLSENLIREYEYLYPSLKQREIASRQEKEQFVALASRSFSWDNFKFKHQYFKKEDYLTFDSSKAAFNTPEIHAERQQVQNKLLELHEKLKPRVTGWGLSDSNPFISSLDPAEHPGNKVRSLWIAYGRDESTLKKYSPTAKATDFMTLQVIIKPSEINVLLMPGQPNSGKEDREYFQAQMNDAGYRSLFFRSLTGLAGAGFWIEIAGEKRKVETLQNEEALWEFTKTDDWRYYTFVLWKSYSPGDPEISNEKITDTIAKEFEKLVVLYRLMKDKSFEED
jgi:hypothetical protein